MRKKRLKTPKKIRPAEIVRLNVLRDEYGRFRGLKKIRERRKK